METDPGTPCSPRTAPFPLAGKSIEWKRIGGIVDLLDNLHFPLAGKSIEWKLAQPSPEVTATMLPTRWEIN